jgi:hypothetical protein
METVEPEYMSIISLGYDIHVTSKRFRAVHIKSFRLLTVLSRVGFILSILSLLIARFFTSPYWTPVVVMLLVLIVYMAMVVTMSNKLVKERENLQKLSIDQQMQIDRNSFEIFNSEIIGITFRKGWLTGEIQIKTEKYTKEFRVEKGLSQTIVTALKLV